MRKQSAVRLNLILPRKKGLFNENGVYNAMLTRTADDLCHSKFSPDDCALGEQIPPDIVRVGSVLLHVFDLHLLSLTVLRVADCRKLSPQCTNLAVPAECSADLAPLFPDMGFSRC